VSFALDDEHAECTLEAFVVSIEPDVPSTPVRVARVACP
jgi:hypothetical protein